MVIPKLIWVNEYEVMQDCKAIIEVCAIFKLSQDFAWAWINSYLERNIKLEPEHI